MTSNLLRPERAVSMMTVGPVMPAVTAVVTIDAPPEFFGTRNKSEPGSICPSRPALLKLNTEFEPSRVMMRSVNVSSERYESPVRTAVPSLTLSFTAAARAFASSGSKFTCRTTGVTRASFCAAWARFATSSAANPAQMEAVLMGVLIGCTA